MMETQEVVSVISARYPNDLRLEVRQCEPQSFQDRRQDHFRGLGTLLRRTTNAEESRRGESHPPALAEPGVSVSAHRAPIAQPPGRSPNRQCAKRLGSRRATFATNSIAR